MSFAEQLKKEMTENAKTILEPQTERKVQLTSFIDHKCNGCNKPIPAGKPLIRHTQKIYNQYSDTPFFKSQYFHDENCEKGLSQKAVKEEVVIPDGFEIVN